MTTTDETTLASYIEYHANRSGFNYRDISVLVGFSTSDALYAMMRGEVKVPIDIIPKLAGALGCSASEMMMLKFKEIFTPELFAELQESFSPDIPNTNDLEWLTTIRSYFVGPLPPLSMKMLRALDKGITSAYPNLVTSLAERALWRDGMSKPQNI